MLFLQQLRFSWPDMPCLGLCKCSEQCSNAISSELQCISCGNITQHNLTILLSNHTSYNHAATGSSPNVCSHRDGRQQASIVNAAAAKAVVVQQDVPGLMQQSQHDDSEEDKKMFPPNPRFAYTQTTHAIQTV